MTIIDLRRRAAQNVQHEYGDAIVSLMDVLAIKRIEEIEGRVPDGDEVAEHGAKAIAPSGAVVFKWKGQPIVEYVPATFGLDGKWRHAEVSEIRQATEADADDRKCIDFSRNGHGT